MNSETTQMLTLVEACSGDAGLVSRASSTSFVCRVSLPLCDVANIRLLSAVIPNSSYSVPGASCARTAGRPRFRPATTTRRGVRRWRCRARWRRCACGRRGGRRTRGWSFRTSRRALTWRWRGRVSLACLGVAARQGNGVAPGAPAGASTPHLYVVRLREAPLPALAHVPRCRTDSITYYRPASGRAQADRRFRPLLVCLRSLGVDIVDEAGRPDLNNLDVSLLFEVARRYRERRTKKKIRGH